MIGIFQRWLIAICVLVFAIDVKVDAQLVIRNGRFASAKFIPKIAAGGFSPDGRLFFAGGDMIRVIDVDSGQLVRDALHAHAQRHRPQVFAARPGNMSETIRDLRSHTTQYMAVSPTSQNAFASSGLDGQISVWTLDQHKPVLRLKSEMKDGGELAFSPTGRYLAVLSSGRKRGSIVSALQVFDLADRSVIHTDHFYNDDLSGVTFIDERTLALLVNDTSDLTGSEIHFLDFPSCEKSKVLALGPGRMQSIAVSPDHRRLVVSGNVPANQGLHHASNGILLSIDLQSLGKPRQIAEHQQGYFSRVIWLPGSQRFAVAMGSHAIGRPTQYHVRVYEVWKGEVLRDWTHDLTFYPAALSASPDGESIAFGQVNKLIILDSAFGKVQKQVTLKKTLFQDK